MQINFLETISKRNLSIITSISLALIVVATGACSKAGGGLSPTDTLKAYTEAAKKKDIAAVKSYLSKGSMKLLEVGAKKMGKTVDESLVASSEYEKDTATPTFANEKITGDTATVDITAGGQTVTMPLVKEDGAWKLAMDKLLQNMGAPVVPSESKTTPPTSTPAPAADEEDHGNSNH